MATMEELAERIARTADDLAVAIGGQTEAVLVRRPDTTSWAAKEIVCHLRDTEELFMLRLEMIAAMDEPLFPADERNFGGSITQKHDEFRALTLDERRYMLFHRNENMPPVPYDVQEIILGMLDPDNPSQRMTAAAALRMPAFRDINLGDEGVRLQIKKFADA